MEQDLSHNLSFYQTLILDIDGVIFNSNKIKENNIFKACRHFTNIETATEFTSYFINLSGVPREIKINSYFLKQPKLASQILNYYNKLNDKSLYSVKLTKGAKDFIKNCKPNIKLVALSGGAEDEIKKLFKVHNLTEYFNYIFGGPNTKKQNIQNVYLKKPLLYIGDSIVDYETAAYIGADFIFMYGYSSHENWKKLLANKTILGTIQNLEEITETL